MKIVICTTPLRSAGTRFPPFGAMNVIQSLRKAGFDPVFYDIDALRPSFEEVERYFKEAQPDILGISAVVSTAYAYTKRLALAVKRLSPKTKIILGGNLAASAEVLHRKVGIDYCVVGEGEIVSPNLVRHIAGTRPPEYEEAALREIRGITFLDSRGEMVFTGYEVPVPPGDFMAPDYSILEKYSKIENFIIDPMTRPDFVQDPRSHEPHRKGQKMAVVVSTKGCVARCTFCHRWDKGYRAPPVEHVIGIIKGLKARYNVGFIQFADESFGSNRRQVEELIEAIKPLDMLFDVAGVRCRTVDPDLLRRLKEAGCVSIYYGMETGSERMLEVMEKKTTLKHNLDAVKWTHEAGLFTVYQLVLAMPGENEETIAESTEFFKKATEILPQPPIERLSVNYIQALPGTPVYEYARSQGLIGKSIEDEEDYLNLVSDTDANDDTKFLNFTDYDYLTVQSWRRRMIVDCTENWMEQRGVPVPSLRDIYRHIFLRRLNPAAYEKLKKAEAARSADGYFNFQRGLYYDLLATRLRAVRTPFLWLWVLTRSFKEVGLGRFLYRVGETIRARLPGDQRRAQAEYLSMRKIMSTMAPKPVTPSESAMEPLRLGR